ncbi:MAG: thioredoxin [Planctomycetia bacterium]|nr:thioredoxin [Planctomycetia bacterium]
MEIEITDATFENEVLNAKGLVLVDFWGTYCRPCLALAPTIEQLAKEYAGRVKICKANVDQNQNSATKFGISSIPALLLFRDGNVIDQMVGLQQKSSLQRFLDGALAQE